MPPKNPTKPTTSAPPIGTLVEIRFGGQTFIGLVNEVLRLSRRVGVGDLNDIVGVLVLAEGRDRYFAWNPEYCRILHEADPDL